MSEEPRFWLPFTRNEIAYMLCVPGLEQLYAMGVQKVQHHELLEAHAAKERKERISLDDIELEIEI